MLSTQEKIKGAVQVLKKELGVQNTLALPRLVKVVVSTGTGSHKDKKKQELIADRLAKITGQKPSPRSAKKSIAGFKSRQGDPIGYMVTLRGVRMYGFLDKLINIAIPRTRDFRGIDPKSIDEIGNMTFGIKEHTIFPETADEDLRDLFGMAITLVTTANNKQQALAFLRTVGIPFKK